MHFYSNGFFTGWFSVFAEFVACANGFWLLPNGFSYFVVGETNGLTKDPEGEAKGLTTVVGVAGGKVAGGVIRGLVMTACFLGAVIRK